MNRPPPPAAVGEAAKIRRHRQSPTPLAPNHPRLTGPMTGPMRLLPTPPDCAFASDNAAGAHPAVLDALVAANSGRALAYGSDR